MDFEQKILLAAVAVGLVGAVVYTKVQEEDEKLKRSQVALDTYDRRNPSIGITPDGKPGELPYRLVKRVTKTANIPTRSPTMATGMQWDYTWNFPTPDDGAFFFTAKMTTGLLIGLSRGMTDTAGGYVIHVLAPDHDNPGSYMYGLSSLENPNKIRAFAKDPEGVPQYHTRTLWVRYMPGGRIALGFGNIIGEHTIFSAPYPYKSRLHNLPVEGIRFIGFGSSQPTPCAIEISNINVLSSQLPS